MYEKHYCWSILLRLFHWMFALSIVVLVVTGFYVNTPWTNTMLEYSQSWPMAWMRYMHFVAGYVFAAAIIIRLFLYIFGNQQERIMDVLPVTGRNLRNFWKTLLHYSYIKEARHHDRLGHNVLAGLTYIVTVVAAIVQIISGFYMLFPEATFWEGWGVAFFGNQQSSRYIHHLLMWWFIIFAMIHVYMCIWNDVKRPEGVISSIFTGDKFTHTKA
jgi:Ni/Fe-hydrogenase 1 B-type cytochrome subunit